ncbi:MAG: oligosaccharide flippase family protein [Armatimonadota bacterium]
MTAATASRIIMNPASVWYIVRSSKLAHDAGKLLALQFAGRVVAFFASAYAMRSLGPEQLGIGAFVLSIVGQVSVLGDLGLNIAGVRALGNHPDRRDEIVSLVWGIRLRVAVVLSLLLLVGVWVFRPIGSMTLWLLAAPLLILSVLSPQWIFQGMERVPAFNAIQLAQTAVTALLYFGLFRPGAQAELYVTVALVTQVLGWSLSYFVLRRQVDVNWLNFDWHQAWEMVRASGYAFGIAFTIFGYGGLEIPLITFFLSPEDAGVYRSAQSIVSVIFPVLAILPLLVYPRLIAWKNRSDQEFTKKAITIMFILAGLVILIDIGAVLLVPIAFRILLGTGFETGIWPCILLFIAKGFTLIGAVPVWGLLAYGLDKYQLSVTLTATIVSFTLNLLLIPRFGIIAAASIIAISESIIFVLSTVLLFIFLKLPRDTTGSRRMSGRIIWSLPKRVTKKLLTRMGIRQFWAKL